MINMVATACFGVAIGDFGTAQTSQPAAAPAENAQAAAASAAPVALSNDDVGFMYGVDFGGQLRALGIAERLSMDAITNGLKDGLDGKQTTTTALVMQAQAFLYFLRHPDDDDAKADPEAYQKKIEEGSAIYGVNFGESIRRVGIADQISADSVVRGMREGMAGTKTLTAQDRQQMAAFLRTALQKQASDNRSAAQEFLARNLHEKGVKTTVSGLQYKVLAAGDRKADSPKSSDVVKVEYRGRLINGIEFDSSYAHGSPASFPVNGVIKGWQEALMLMKPGAKWELFVPPDLAYGDASKPRIPRGSLLIFDVELVGVREPENAASPAPTGQPTEGVNSGA